jgi:L-ascorbate metabolism protein UlaG (beta-lactamase superfamily)
MATMTELVHLGHACVVVDTGDDRVLLDPGAFSDGYQTLEGLTGILVTHQHFDHLDLEKLPALLQRNPTAELVVDPGTSDVLRERGINHTRREPGEIFTLVGSTEVEVAGAARGEHAVIHPDIPTIPNNGYVLRSPGGTVMHPGDAYIPAPDGVDVLLLPTGAPWLKVSEAVDYLRAVTPPVAIPIHEAVLANPDLHYGLFDALSPERTDVRVLERGVTTAL